ncbi:MAG: hypothetical protein ACI9KE_000273 [Polyangiales bacterium]|jgi:hypothetical protein
MRVANSGAHFHFGRHMKSTFSLLLFALLTACADDTRVAGDAAALDSSTDAPASDGGGDTGPLSADGDMDGVVGLMDLCPSTAAGDPIDVNGCSTADVDGDGVLNDMDRCNDTPAGSNVDGLGCPLGDQGTLDANWLINGAAATAASCSAAGVVQVRLIVDRPGANFLMRDFPCAQASFDGREDMTAPRVPRNETFTIYWQAINSGGAVIAETESMSLLLRDVEHASLAPADLVITE